MTISSIASCTPSTSGIDKLWAGGMIVERAGSGEVESSPVVVANDAVVNVVTVAAMVLASARLALNCLTSLLKSGRNRVHQKAIRMPLSTTRCFRMRSTTRKKKATAAKIRRRSSQSDFSRAIMRCLDVLRRVERVSCAAVVERKLADDCSSNCE